MDNDASLRDRATHEPSPDGLGHSVGIPSAYATGASIERGAFYSDGVTEAWCADVECGQGSEHVATIYARSSSEAVFWADLVAWVMRNPEQVVEVRGAAA